MNQAAKKAVTTVIVFFALAMLLSAVIFFGLRALDASRRIVFWASMWGPGLAALIVSYLYYGSIRHLGWRWGKTRYQLLALALPFIFCIATYNYIWFSGLGGFEPIPGLNLWTVLSGLLIWIIPSLGEEIGWRGFLVPELARVTGFVWVGVISGLLWATWHVPVMVIADYGQGAPLWYTIPIFYAFVVAASIPMAWLRLKSGSVWTAVLYHSANNYFVQSLFDEMTVDTGATHYLRGEFGALTVISLFVLAVIFYRKRHELPLHAV